MPLVLPNPTFTNGQVADAARVMANFHTIADYLNSDLVQADALLAKKHLSPFASAMQIRQNPDIGASLSYDPVAIWKAPVACTLHTFEAVANFAGGVGDVVVFALWKDVGAGWVLVGTVTCTNNGTYVSTDLAGHAIAATNLLKMTLATTVGVVNLRYLSFFVDAKASLEAA